MTGLGFLPIARRALFISTYNGLYKGKGPKYIYKLFMLPRADDNRKVNISRKRMHKKWKEEERENNNTASDHSRE
jgi:hypothetical protein